jgi:hypothetical protein
MDILVSPTAELPSHHHNIIIVVVISSLLFSPCPHYAFHSNSLSFKPHTPNPTPPTHKQSKKTKNWMKRRQKKELKDKKPDSSKCHRRVVRRRIATLELKVGHRSFQDL